MEFLVSDLIETLRRLPPPTIKGERYTTPVYERTYMQLARIEATHINATLSVIRVRADIVNDGAYSELKWFINV